MTPVIHLTVEDAKKVVKQYMNDTEKKEIDISNTPINTLKNSLVQFGLIWRDDLGNFMQGV